MRRNLKNTGATKGRQTKYLISISKNGYKRERHRKHWKEGGQYLKSIRKQSSESQLRKSKWNAMQSNGGKRSKKDRQEKQER